jgi:hypothetical protein
LIFYCLRTERNGNDERLARVGSTVSAEGLSRLAEGAGFVFRGRAVPHQPENAEIGLGEAETTATVEVQEVLLGTDVTRGLVGHDVTVVSDDAAAIVEEAAPFVFFTNCVSLGDRVIAREVGRREASSESVREVTEALRLAAERPLVERVAAADLIVTGEVASSRPLERPFPPRSEHDPDWWIASVTVGSVIKGRRRARIEVLFANSMDIAWYRSPKLREGASGIFILRPRSDDEAPADVPPTVYQATDPLDFLPTDRLPDVQRAVERDEEGG